MLKSIPKPIRVLFVVFFAGIAIACQTGQNTYTPPPKPNGPVNADAPDVGEVEGAAMPAPGSIEGDTRDLGETPPADGIYR